MRGVSAMLSSKSQSPHPPLLSNSLRGFCSGGNGTDILITVLPACPRTAQLLTSCCKENAWVTLLEDTCFVTIFSPATFLSSNLSEECLLVFLVVHRPCRTYSTAAGIFLTLRETVLYCFPEYSKPLSETQGD